jgi:two-component system, chemotaxis family, chemotaxis protein CheY
MKWDSISAVVASDEKSSRKIFVEILRAAGMQDIRPAVDGAAALEAMTERVPSFVTIDFELSRDGATMLRRIRENSDDRVRRVPVLVVTSMATRAIIAAVRDAGANEVVTKPLTVGNVIGRISALLQHTRPFIDAATYKGPDRRRTGNQPYFGALRRETDVLAEIIQI